MVIDSFRGKYFFLSNFYNAEIECFGYHFKNNEAAFQAAKCPQRMAEFCELNPSDAKRLGRHMTLRHDWEKVKNDVMYQVCLAKFTQHADLTKLLAETGDAVLIEGNTWGDHVWGMVNGIGENRLEKILMRIRSELKG